MYNIAETAIAMALITLRLTMKLTESSSSSENIKYLIFTFITCSEIRNREQNFHKFHFTVQTTASSLAPRSIFLFIDHSSRNFIPLDKNYLDRNRFTTFIVSTDEHFLLERHAFTNSSRLIRLSSFSSISRKAS